MNQVAIPTKNAGEVYIPALGKTFQQIELREDDVFDSIVITSGAQSTGAEYVFWRDIQNKFLQHTNLPQSRKIQSGDEVAVFRIGLHPREAVGNTLPVFNDYRKLVGCGHLEVNFNRRRVTEGPVIKYASGYGMGGYSDESSCTAVSIGVPSQAAAPTLFVPQQLTDNDTLASSLFFKDASGWLTATALGTGSYAAPNFAGPVVVTLFLHGVMKAPLGK